MNIKEYIDTNGILKSVKMMKKNEELQKELWPYSYSFDKVSEILYCSYNNIEPPMCTYGNKRKFLDFSSGYNLSCNLAKSKKCNCSIDRRKELIPLILQNKDKKEEYSKKRKKTNLEKYGCENVFQSDEIQEKYKKVLLEKYGNTNPMKIDEFKEKYKNTNLEKYGCENVFQSDEIKLKIQRNNLEKYGIKNQKQKHINPLFFDIIKNKHSFNNYVINKSYQDLLKEFNISSTLLSKWISYYNSRELIKYSISKSKEEIDVFNFLSNITENIQSSNRDIIKPKEIDIFLPDYNLGIEYNGLYWHTESKGRDKNYHKNKLLECNKQGIDLIQIFSDEWIKKRKIVESIIKSKLGLNEKIYARKTEIKEISEKESKLFLENNHLQGNVIGANKRYGLYYNNSLVSIMTFQLKNNVWELKRYANKINVNVIGGASKLFKYFIKENSPKEIFSYCDLRYFNGKIYESLGFTYDKTTQPSYYYTDGINRYHRLNFTKKKLIEMGHDSSKTEEEIMSELGYDKIYDCGHSKWIMLFQTNT